MSNNKPKPSKIEEACRKLDYTEVLEVHVMKLEQELKQANELLKQWRLSKWSDFLDNKGDSLMSETIKHLEKVK